MPVTLSPEADDDLRAILDDGFVRWGDDLALDYAARLTAAFQQIATFPELGHRVTGLPDRFRLIRVRRHRIFYRLDGEQVLVVRILHERSDTPVLDE